MGMSVDGYYKPNDVKEVSNDVKEEVRTIEDVANQEVPPETYKKFQDIKRVFYPSEGANLSLHESWDLSQKIEDLSKDVSGLQERVAGIEKNYYLTARRDFMNNLDSWVSSIPEIAQKIGKNDDSSVPSTKFGERTFKSALV